MRATLFTFQETALADLHGKIQKAHTMWSEKDPQVISLSAPTGAGKTIIMTALFEEIIFGHAYGVAEPDSVFVWLSDMPELNQQTRLKIESKSDKFRTRDVHVIDSNFDAEFFAPGSINFLNTQRLGTDKLLTGTGDARQYTIWQTLANTAKRQPKSFYVAIDEAHRGTSTPQTENKAQSIMQKFIRGSKEDGMPIMPLVIGVTATPQRFQKLVENSSSTIQKVIVPPEDVIESGLLKDRIIIHFPEMALGADMTMFKEAAVNWKKKCGHWAAYCEHEEIAKPVRPILVVQVQDGTDRGATQTDLASCFAALEELLGRKLKSGEAVHTFNDQEAVNIGEYELRRIDASRIEEDETAMVVFFKMNLSTGWDCPRAETMMSFRHASDYTYIAQLLGRMIRTPLARRVESDAELNNVALYLPFFDEETVKNVEQALRDSEAIVPAETGTHREFVTLKRDPSFADVFSDMDLITYRVDAARKQPALRRLMALARALTQDMIAPDARRSALKKVLDKFDEEIAALRESGKYDEIERAVTALALKTLTIDYGTDMASTADSETVELSEFDLTNLFERAGKVLGGDLHTEYWIRHSIRDAEDVKTEIIAMANETAIMEQLDACAEKLFNELYDYHKAAFKKLKEERKDTYKKLALSSAIPIALAWDLPQSIDFLLGDDTDVFENHLFIPTDGGDFKVSLNDWEAGVVREELANGAVAWLRNLDRKKWSLEIPYEAAGVTASMFPDLLVVRADAHGYVFDVLEPHDPSRKDNYPKAVGLAKFAEKHGGHFGRIQLIRKVHKFGRDIFYRLDMNKTEILGKVRGVASNEELDRIFDDDAAAEE
ncbi:MAG: DEAD/DEAH box helicase family protein [Clostridiales Family XIII bacterium]|jgi:type III restriction enzyme|nr:DEAD/DEAH box helicase family protein [Clostridiales Family XIII bacterium]